MPHAADPRASGRTVAGGDVVGLLVGVLLFGYFGFLAGLSAAHPVDGRTVPLFAAFLWTLRVSAIGLAIALLLLLMRWRAASLVAGVVGLAGALAFLALAAWDAIDTSLALAIGPVLLVVFAILNGWTAVGALREWREATPRQAAID